MDVNTTEPTSLSAPQNELLLHLAKSFVERVEALSLKGKKRDDAALDYFCGAAAMLKHLGHEPELQAVGFNIYMISIRGYLAVREIIQHHEKPG